MDNSRICFWAAGLAFAVFVLDILVAKFQVMNGATVPVHLGPTIQFLVLLVVVVFFVAGTLIRERREASAPSRNGR